MKKSLDLLNISYMRAFQSVQKRAFTFLNSTLCMQYFEDKNLHANVLVNLFKKAFMIHAKKVAVLHKSINPITV